PAQRPAADAEPVLLLAHRQAAPGAVVGDRARRAAGGAVHAACAGRDRGRDRDAAWGDGERRRAQAAHVDADLGGARRAHVGDRRGGTMSSGRRRVGLVLVGLAIAVLAIAARYWRLRWGLTLGMAFTDELQMWPSYLNAFVPLRPESFLRADQPGAMIYPAFYGFLSGLAVAVAHGLGLMAAPQADVFSALYMARLVAATASTL